MSIFGPETLRRLPRAGGARPARSRLLFQARFRCPENEVSGLRREIAEIAQVAGRGKRARRHRRSRIAHRRGELDKRSSAIRSQPTIRCRSPSWKHSRRISRGDRFLPKPVSAKSKASSSRRSRRFRKSPQSSPIRRLKPCRRGRRSMSPIMPRPTCRRPSPTRPSRCETKRFPARRSNRRAGNAACMR